MAWFNKSDMKNATNLIHDSRLLHYLISTMAIVGIIGNLLLLLVIIRSRRLLDPTYIYIANITASDFSTSLQIFVVNIFLAIKVTLEVDAWILFCKVLSLIFFVSILTSSLSLLAVSLYRLKIVLEPINFRSTSALYKHRSKCVLLIWITGLLGAAPVYLLTSYHSEPQTCFIGYPYGQMVNIIYYSVTLIGGYFVPIIIMMYCYIRIFQKLTSTSPTLLQTSSHSNVTTTNRSIKAVKFMLAVTCIYMLLILPFISWMLGLSFAYQSQASLISAMPELSLLLAMAFGCSYLVCILNPLLFLIFDKNIKSKLSKILPVITCA